MTKQKTWIWRALLLGLLPFLQFGTTGCVLGSEYVRMQRALGAEIIELRQGKKLGVKKLAKMEARIKALRAQLKKKDTSYASLEKKFKGAIDGQKKLEAKIRSLLRRDKLRQSEISKCGDMLKGKGKKLFELQTQLAKKEQELQAKQDQFTAKQAEFKKKNAALLADIKKKQDALKASLEKVRKLEKQINALKRIYTELTSRLRSLVKAGKLKITMIQGLLKLQMPEKILFSSGSSRVKAEGRRTIAKVASILKTLKYRWQVMGHTDSRGAAKFNWRLSARRATAVLFVMLKAGMPAEQVFLAGAGQYQPTAGNDTAANRALNRRTELILVPDLSDLYSSLQFNKKKPE